MIVVSSRGDFSKTRSFLERSLNAIRLGELDRYGKMGVDALRNATPRDTGKTAESWDYKIIRKDGNVSIVWTNSNMVNDYNVALLVQYGHRMKNGYWLNGVDYINPALAPVFDEIGKGVWWEVTKR